MGNATLEYSKSTPPGRGVVKGQTGFLEGIIPIQDELWQTTNFFVNFVVLALEFLEEEARRISARAQAQAGLTLEQRLAIGAAIGDYVRERRGTVAKQARLAAARMAVEGIHALVQLENDAAKLRTLHTNKVQLIMYLFEQLIGMMKSLQRMSDALKRAEALL